MLSVTLADNCFQLIDFPLLPLVMDSAAFFLLEISMHKSRGSVTILEISNLASNARPFGFIIASVIAGELPLVVPWVPIEGGLIVEARASSREVVAPLIAGQWGATPFCVNLQRTAKRLSAARGAVMKPGLACSQNATFTCQVLVLFDI